MFAAQAKEPNVPVSCREKVRLCEQGEVPRRAAGGCVPSERFKHAHRGGVDALLTKPAQEDISAAWTGGGVSAGIAGAGELLAQLPSTLAGAIAWKRHVSYWPNNRRLTWSLTARAGPEGCFRGGARKCACCWRPGAALLETTGPRVDPVLFSPGTRVAPRPFGLLGGREMLGRLTWGPGQPALPEGWDTIFYSAWRARWLWLNAARPGQSRRRSSARQ